MNEPAHPGSRVTLVDIANHTGFSRALVSIVMRGVPGASARTRKTVLDAAAELGYRPDVRARSLAGQSSRIVGVVFGVAGTFHFKLLDGLYKAAEASRYELMLSAITPGRTEEQAVSTLQDFRFDALIMLGPPSPKPLMAGRVPLVVIGWEVDDVDVDSIRTSDAHGMELAVSHLTELGHQRIIYIDGGGGVISDARRDGFLAAMASRGLSGSARVIPGGDTQLAGQEAAQRILAMGARPTAIIAYNDDVAVAASAVLQQHGLHVPGDVAIVGWDNSEASLLSGVELTTITQEPRDLARRAFERVLERLEGLPIESSDIVLEPSLIARASTIGRPHVGPML